MTVTNSGAIFVGPNDFQFMNPRTGVNVAIKIRADFDVIVGCIQGPSGWAGEIELYMFSQGTIGTAQQEIDKVGGAVNWVKTVLVPIINKWFVQVFPPVANAPSPAPSGDAYQQIDLAILGLMAKIVVAADGTVQVKV